MKTIKFEETENSSKDLKHNNTASGGKPERRKSEREVNKVWEKSCCSGHLFTQSIWKLIFWKSPISISGQQQNYAEKSSLSYFHLLALPFSLFTQRESHCKKNNWSHQLHSILYCFTNTTVMRSFWQDKKISRNWKGRWLPEDSIAKILLWTEKMHSTCKQNMAKV